MERATIVLVVMELTYSTFKIVKVKQELTLSIPIDIEERKSRSDTFIFIHMPYGSRTKLKTNEKDL